MLKTKKIRKCAVNECPGFHYSLETDEYALNSIEWNDSVKNVPSFESTTCEYVWNSTMRESFESVRSVKKNISTDSRYKAVYSRLICEKRMEKILSEFEIPEETLHLWINRYINGNLNRKSLFVNISSYGISDRQFILHLIKNNTRQSLETVRRKFIHHQRKSITITKIVKILEEEGCSYRVLKRLSESQKLKETCQFFNQIHSLPQGWNNNMLVFLDDDHFTLMSDNSSEATYRLAVLAFSNIQGLLDISYARSSIDHIPLETHLRRLLESGTLQPYPCPNSILISSSPLMNSKMVAFVQSRGIHVINLPTHSEYNPSYTLFGCIKEEFSKCQHKSLGNFLNVLESRNFDLSQAFHQCGFQNGVFDPWNTEQ